MNPLVIGPLAEIVKNVVGRIWPDPTQQAEAQYKLAQMVQTGELAQLAAQTDLMKGQIAVNQAEASSGDPFTSRARPFIMWICGFALLYASFIEPLSRFVAVVFFKYHGAFPAINTDITLQLLFGILGLGAYRTVEKVKGVA